MAEWVKPIAEVCAATIELLGVLIITAVALYALGLAGLKRLRHQTSVASGVRHQLAHGILLGLEFLVAADIIHTVAVELTFRTVGVLAIVVLIRTFLSFSLELELNGRWPWQRA